VLERSLEIAEVLREGMMKTGSWFAHILEKGSGKLISSVFNEFKLATNKTLGYDMPRLRLPYNNLGHITEGSEEYL